MVCMMSNQHRDKPLNVRPPTEDREAAQAVLKAQRRDMTSFITACLRKFVAEPDKMIEFVGTHWPEPKPRGRPPKDESPH